MASNRKDAQQTELVGPAVPAEGVTFRTQEGFLPRVPVGTRVVVVELDPMVTVETADAARRRFAVRRWCAVEVAPESDDGRSLRARAVAAVCGSSGLTAGEVAERIGSGSTRASILIFLRRAEQAGEVVVVGRRERASGGRSEVVFGPPTVPAVLRPEVLSSVDEAPGTPVGAIAELPPPDRRAIGPLLRLVGVSEDAEHAHAVALQRVARLIEQARLTRDHAASAGGPTSATPAEASLWLANQLAACRASLADANTRLILERAAGDAVDAVLVEFGVSKGLTLASRVRALAERRSDATARELPPVVTEVQLSIPHWSDERIAALGARLGVTDALRWVLGRAPSREELIAAALGAIDDRLGPLATPQTYQGEP